jgi:hypothetical protein
MKRKWFFVVITSFLVSLAVFAFLLFYAVWGGKYYFEAKRGIAKLPSDKKSYAESIFSDITERSYPGVLMGVVETGIHGVWVWGDSGPRFFRSSSYSVYSYFQMCKPEVLEKIKAGINSSPFREVTKSIGEWKDEVKTGNFLSVMISLPGSGENAGKIKEVHAYDWWMFNPALPVDKQCEN